MSPWDLKPTPKEPASLNETSRIPKGFQDTSITPLLTSGLVGCLGISDVHCVDRLSSSKGRGR